MLKSYDRDEVFNVDTFLPFFPLVIGQRSDAPPYFCFVALCGLFTGTLAVLLIFQHLQDVNTRVAALTGKHPHIAQLLYVHGAAVDALGRSERALHGKSIHDGYSAMVRM
jgi:hypothetical protein